MVLKEKEKTAVKDLQTQEETCIKKYGKYKEEAKDPVLKELFQTLQQKEQEHFNSLQQVLDGTVHSCNCNDSDGKNYEPKATYNTLTNSDDKKSDNFIVTDCIATEKLVSSEYNMDVFLFADAALRKLLAYIQIEEQNHAHMLYKYKMANGMA